MSYVYESFCFQAERVDIYENNRHIKSIACQLSITANATDRDISFHIPQNDIIDNIYTHFTFDFQPDDIHIDRIQYGHRPENAQLTSTTIPIACNIHPHEHRIRFILIHPLRLIEFTGTITKTT